MKQDDFLVITKNHSSMETFLSSLKDKQILYKSNNEKMFIFYMNYFTNSCIEHLFICRKKFVATKFKLNLISVISLICYLFSLSQRDQLIEITDEYFTNTLYILAFISIVLFNLRTHLRLFRVNIEYLNLIMRSYLTTIKTLFDYLGEDEEWVEINKETEIQSIMYMFGRNFIEKYPLSNHAKMFVLYFYISFSNKLLLQHNSIFFLKDNINELKKVIIISGETFEKIKTKLETFKVSH